MRDKGTGIVRKVDEQGRIVLPADLRRTLGINLLDPLEIYGDGDCIILRRYRPICLFCGDLFNMHEFMGKNVCKACVTKLAGELRAHNTPMLTVASQ